MVFFVERVHGYSSQYLNMAGTKLLRNGDHHLNNFSTRFLAAATILPLRFVIFAFQFSFDIIPADEETELGSLRRTRSHVEVDSKCSKSKELEVSDETDSEAENTALDEIDEDEEIIKEIQSSRSRKNEVVCLFEFHVYTLCSFYCYTNG